MKRTRDFEVECDVRTCRQPAAVQCKDCTGLFCEQHITVSAQGQPVCAECWALVPPPPPHHEHEWQAHS